MKKKLSECLIKIVAASYYKEMIQLSQLEQ